MKVIHVTRAPLSEKTVAANALRWGTGGYNIDDSRISVQGQDYARNCSGDRGHEKNRTRNMAFAMGCGKANKKGRWPANVVLQHTPECRCRGLRRVQGSRVDTRPEGDGGRADKSQWRFRPTAATKRGYSDENGMETVPFWDCAPRCPVTALDAQTGDINYGGNGGASRFFQQVQGGILGEKNQRSAEMASPVPQQLIEYLTNMIGTPEEPGIYWDHIHDDALKGLPDNTLPGLLLAATPTEEQTKELMRVLRPGAHLLLVAPEDEPTGHTGACRLEDNGFEIRDAILWVGPGDGDAFHYVPKASRSEREEGCHLLPGKTPAQAVDRKEDSTGAQHPRAGANRPHPDGENAAIKNFHPCLHPAALVLTDKGYRPISEIRVGDEVYTKSGAFHVVDCVSHHPYTSPNLYEISVRGTTSTTLASDNHPFLIWRPSKEGLCKGKTLWVEAKDLQVGDYTMTPLNQEGRAPSVEGGFPVLRGLQFQREGQMYQLAFIQSVDLVPYEGDVWNLTVEGDPTFQTAVGMSHNTVKPYRLMERLLRDVPKDQGPILDPFMGSGSTGIACVQTGHDFVGIEREEDYHAIATTRISYWKDKVLGDIRNAGRHIEVLSEFTPPKAEEKEDDSFDWLMG